MNFFRIIRTKYAILGISFENQLAQNCPANKRILFGFLLFGSVIVLQLMYIFYVASGFTEFVICISTTYATIIIFVAFATIVFKRTLLFDNIKKVEKFIDTSETHFSSYNSMCVDENRILTAGLYQLCATSKPYQ